LEIEVGELGGDPAPAERQPGTEHRHERQRTAEAQQQIGQQACHRQRTQHQRERGPVRVRVAARGGAEPGAGHAQHDHGDREALAAAGALAQHALAQHHQHRQPQRQRRCDHHQRRQRDRREL